MSVPDMAPPEIYIGGEDISQETRYKFIDGIDEFLNMGDTHLFPGQLEAVEALREIGEIGGGSIVMPTGSGKTEIFGEVIRATGMKTLIVTPTVELVGQTIKRLNDRGLTSIRSVSPYDHENAATQVSVTTYAGFVKRVGTPSQRYLIDPRLYEMVIYDEAHHLGTEASLQAMKHFGHAYQIGFTASPDYSEARRLEDVMGKPVFDKGITEANREGLVSDFSSFVFSLDTDLSTVRMTRGDYERESLSRHLNTPERNAAIAEMYHRTLLGKKALFACANVTHADSMAEALQDVGVTAEAVHTSMPRNERRDRIDRFRSGETVVLVYARLLNEGFDEKSIEAIINVSPTASIVLQRQRCGRGMRSLAEFVKRAVIIDCIDRNYPRRPVLISDEAIYNRSELITHSREEASANALDEVLRTYRDEAGNRMLADEEVEPTITEGRARFRHDFGPRKQRKTRTIDDDLIDSLGLSTDRDDWWTDTLCTELGDSFEDAFFPEKGKSSLIARFACSLCRVQDDCLDDALREPRQFGVKAGLNANHRTRFLSQLRKLDNEPSPLLAELRDRQTTSLESALRAYENNGLSL